jgi:hypothetical protein
VGIARRNYARPTLGGTMKATLAAVLTLFSLELHAAPCAGFIDVQDTDAFCPSVAWMKNRGVTTGCTATAYCPNDAVTRLQMAGFLSRMDRVLPMTLVDANGIAIGSVVSQDGGALKIAYRKSGRVHLFEIGMVPGATALGYVPLHYFVTFATPNCAGTGYRNYATWPPGQSAVLTASGASVTVNGPAGQRRLYASPSPLPSALPNGVITGQSYLDITGACIGLTPSPLDYALPMTLVEDLAAKFVEPYQVQ